MILIGEAIRGGDKERRWYFALSFSRRRRFFDQLDSRVGGKRDVRFAGPVVRLQTETTPKLVATAGLADAFEVFPRGKLLIIMPVV